MLSLRKVSLLASLHCGGGILLLLGLLASGCASQRNNPPIARRLFNFPADTFAFANQLVWEYHYDENGKWVSQPRDPKPEYSHHCFVVARSVKQFFEHARFDPAQPAADADTYRRLIHRVISVSASRELTEADKIVIPGYADLRSFSEAQANLLKSECGGAWHSYFQHGHWRMIMPFTRHQQENVARQLLDDLAANCAPIVHLVRFPQLTINHAIILFDAKESPEVIVFSVYDPNNPKAPTTLTFDRATRTFQFPANDYFPGGRVDVYEVYRNWLY
jgi:hypothetical protein